MNTFVYVGVFSLFGINLCLHIRMYILHSEVLERAYVCALSMK